jgi:hypothetical protein
MAIVITQPKSGSVGPSTFATSKRYGTVERARVKPRNPRTPAQQDHRTVVKATVRHWRELTEAERAGWRALGRQLPKELTGYTAYVSVNVTLQRWRLPRLEAAPPTPAFGTLSCTGLVVEDTPLVKVLGVSDTFAPDKFIVAASAPVSAGIADISRAFRELTIVDGHAGPAVDLDLTAVYVARFGVPPAGQRVVVRLIPVKDGFEGEPVECGAIAAARGPGIQQKQTKRTKTRRASIPA